MSAAQLLVIRGDATKPHCGKGPKIIAHVCNDLGGWGKGFVLSLEETFRKDGLGKAYRRWHKSRNAHRKRASHHAAADEAEEEAGGKHDSRTIVEVPEATAGNDAVELLPERRQEEESAAGDAAASALAEEGYEDDAPPPQRSPRKVGDDANAEMATAEDDRRGAASSLSKDVASHRHSADEGRPPPHSDIMGTQRPQARPQRRRRHPGATAVGGPSSRSDVIAGNHNEHGGQSQPAITGEEANDVLEQQLAEGAAGGGGHDDDGGDEPFRLGAVQFLPTSNRFISIANMVAQHGLKNKSKHPGGAVDDKLDYAALAEALGKVGRQATAGACSVHMPRIGCGLAGGDWERVERIIREELVEKAGVNVWVYELS